MIVPFSRQKRVRSGIQTCTVRSQMSQSDVPIQNSQYVALFDDFCILVAPESDFPIRIHVPVHVVLVPVVCGNYTTTEYCIGKCIRDVSSYYEYI